MDATWGAALCPPCAGAVSVVRLGRRCEERTALTVVSILATSSSKAMCCVSSLGPGRVLRAGCSAVPSCRMRAAALFTAILFYSQACVSWGLLADGQPIDAAAAAGGSAARDGGSPVAACRPPPIVSSIPVCTDALFRPAHDWYAAVEALLQLKAALPGRDEQMRQASHLDGWSVDGGGRTPSSACSWSFVHCVQGRVNSL